MTNRVAIIADTFTHMMPALARAMAKRDHNLVIGMPASGLPDELQRMGIEVEVVDGVDDHTKPEAVKLLVERAKARFGKFDSACIRTGAHVMGDILDATADEFQTAYEGNMLSVFYALQALQVDGRSSNPPSRPFGYCASDFGIRFRVNRRSGRAICYRSLDSLVTGF